MARVLRTHQAEIDLVEILIPLYERSAAAGDRLADRIEKRCERLARLPEVGSRCEDLAPRLLAVKNIEWWTIDMCFWAGSWELIESSRRFVNSLLQHTQVLR